MRRGSSRTTISPHAHRTRQVVMLTLDLAVRSTSIGGRLAHLAPPCEEGKVATVRVRSKIQEGFDQCQDVRKGRHRRTRANSAARKGPGKSCGGELFGVDGRIRDQKEDEE